MLDGSLIRIRGKRIQINNSVPSVDSVSDKSLACSSHSKRDTPKRLQGVISNPLNICVR